MDSFFVAIHRALFVLFNDSYVSIVFVIIAIIGLVIAFAKSYK